MQLVELIQRLQEFEPDATDTYIARFALLVTKNYPLDELDLNLLEETYRDLVWSMKSLHDQQAAAAEELNDLAASAPEEFSPKHLWTLVRSLKVQSQLLDCYLD